METDLLDLMINDGSFTTFLHNTVTLFRQHAATHSFFLSSTSLLSPSSSSPTVTNFVRLLQTETRQQVVKMVGSNLTSSKSSGALLSLTSDFHELLDFSIGVYYESSELCSDILENRDWRTPPAATRRGPWACP